MAWSTPPTFADANILSASQLNTLSDNQDYLKGLLDGATSEFAVVTATGDTTEDFGFRYLGGDIHYKFAVTNGTMSTLRIRAYDVNDTLIETIFNDVDNETATQADWDDTMTPASLVEGTWYRFEVYLDFAPSQNGTMYCLHVGNVPT